MKIIIATNNEKKLLEMRQILERTEIDFVSLRDMCLDISPNENGDTFQQNALIKARAVVDISGIPAVADDSGIEVFALENRPGIYSARYGAPCAVSDADRNRLLLTEMRDIHEEKRGARFVCCIACVFPDGRIITSRGECYGTILRLPSGTGGFGYDPIFYIEEYAKTFAELSQDEKNEISHRSVALRDFSKKLFESGYCNDKK